MRVILLNLIKQQQQGQGQSGQAKTLPPAGIATVRAWVNIGVAVIHFYFQFQLTYCAGFIIIKIIFIFSY